MPDLLKLIAEKGVLLADGATGTNLFDMGLTSGDAPELWNVSNPEKIAELHRRFIEAGADIVLTNTFGANRHRLKLHGFEDRVRELNMAGADLAHAAADGAGRPVVVAGSVGPTGELFEPLGKLSEPEAVEAFHEQAEALRDGGVDALWIETMSAPEEMRAAAEAAALAGMPFVITASFDTAGRTMMGLPPGGLGSLAGEFRCAPAAFGANCGVGASDLLVAILEITGAHPEAIVVAKGNCGIPEIRGEEVVYTGTPELMARYAQLAIDAGARIIGGCCGTSFDHLAAMRRALDTHVPRPRPDVATIVSEIGPLVSPPRAESGVGDRRPGRRRRGS